MSNSFNSFWLTGAFCLGAAVSFALRTDTLEDDIVVPDVTSKEPVRSLIESGVATKGDFEAAAQRGIDGLAAVASQQFPGTVNGLPVDTHALTRKAVEAYLAGDKSNPPVVKVPAVEKPAVLAP